MARPEGGIPNPAMLSIRDIPMKNLNLKMVKRILVWMRKNKIDGYLVIYADYGYRDMFNRKFNMTWNYPPKNWKSKLLSKIGWFFVEENDARTKVRVVLSALKDFNELVIFENPSDMNTDSSIYHTYDYGKYIEG